MRGHWKEIRILFRLNQMVFYIGENLETGDQVKNSIDFKIQSLLITDNEIIVIPEYYDRGDEIIGYGFDGFN